MPILTGIVSKVVTDRVPSMLNITTPIPQAGVQLAVAFGGGMLLQKFIGRANANVWTLMGVITVATNLLNTYILKTTLSGLGAYPGSYLMPSYPAEQAYGAFPNELSGMGAYPYDMVEY